METESFAGLDSQFDELEAQLDELLLDENEDGEQVQLPEWACRYVCAVYKKIKTACKYHKKL